MVGIVIIISKKTNLAKCTLTQLFLLFYGFIANLLHKLERVRCEYCTGRGGATQRDLTELISTF